MFQVQVFYLGIGHRLIVCEGKIMMPHRTVNDESHHVPR